jgi:hypothetical protein
MSKIALSGNALGTGTLTIASPNTNTDRTLTLPDNSGTLLSTASAGVPINGPAFSAYASAAQSMASSVYTKLQANVELFDTNSNYDSVTNYRFTPTVAGYYQVTGSWLTTVATGQNASAIYKNGVGVLTTAAAPFSVGAGLLVTGLIFMNGSTDYVEFFGRQTSGASYTTVAGAPDLYFFQAFLARSAT